MNRQHVDLRTMWDLDQPLANPHKGWYHHYPDNALTKYIIRDDRDLTEFGGMDHLYLRLAWSYLEPTEGDYRWEVIDDIADKWRALGLGIALRISCRETSVEPIEQKFATPRWVIEAGAEGGHYALGKTPGDPALPWEPVYDDPVYLAKVEAFVAALAARYDGQPWLRYVDIGSLGDWGEGHTSHGSNLEYDWRARQAHLDLYRRHFRQTLLVAPDEMTDKEPTPEGQAILHRHIVDNGITYRDDSILVDWFVRNWPDTASVKHPDYFDAVAHDRPTILELQHYPIIKRDGNWLPAPGSVMAQHGGSGPDYFRQAIRLMHATYIGYHGDAREWLDDNPSLTGELLNRCGYWYVPHAATLPTTLVAGGSGEVSMVWENRGAARAYDDFTIVFRLAGPGGEQTIELPSGNRDWLPTTDGRTHQARYRLAVSGALPPGDYRLGFRLHSRAAGREVQVALAADSRDADGFHHLGSVAIA